MSDTVTRFLWAVLPSLFVGILMAVWNRQQKGKDSEREKAEKDRLKSETLRISLLLATARLSYASAMAFKRGSPNGEMETAFEQYNRAMNKFRDFEREQIARNSAGCDF